MQRPSYLSKYGAMGALCLHFNLQPTMPSGAVGASFDMKVAEVIRDACTPTHVLAATQPDQPSSSPPLIVPIDAALFAQGFRIELALSPAAPWSTAPTPRTVGDSQDRVINLPVVEIVVPHVASLALLLLYGMGLESENNPLAWALLPVSVVEEFPNAAAMSLILSRNVDERFDRIFRHNQGIWRNILAMGLRDTRILELVSTAWNVTAEARRIRQRSRQ